MEIVFWNIPISLLASVFLGNKGHMGQKTPEEKIFICSILACPPRLCHQLLASVHTLHLYTHCVFPHLSVLHLSSGQHVWTQVTLTPVTTMPETPQNFKIHTPSMSPWGPKLKNKPGMVAYSYNLGTLKARVGSSPVWGHPGLQGKILTQYYNTYKKYQISWSYT